MRTLTPTLLSAQKSASRRPYVKIEARNTPGGAVKLNWTRLYTGAESENQHSLTLPADGSLVRVRITPQSDSRRLYRQRVVNPGPGADFSQWTYHSSQYGILAAAVGSLGSEVSLAWIRSSGEVRRAKSTDNGATWPVTDYPGYAPGSYATGLAAAYKPNGDLALFFTEAQALFAVLNLNGVWQNRLAWNRSTGDLSGVAAVYAGGDWKLIVTGKDADGNFKVWSLIYGDGGEAAAGSWTELKTVAAAPADGSYEYTRAFLEFGVGSSEPGEIYRLSFIEKYTGNQAYERPFLSRTLPGTAFPESRWREAEPVEVGSEETGAGSAGLATGHHGNYAWMGCASGVWRAELAVETRDLGADLLSVKQELSPDGGRLVVELGNDRGQYTSPGSGGPDLLEAGNELAFSPGYLTPAGGEVSEGTSFIVQSLEHTSGSGRAGLVIYAADGWTALENWTARHQLRWNRPDRYGDPTREASVSEIIAQVLARAGLKLEAIAASAAVTGFYPDFTVHAGDSGKAVVRRLLSFVPDVLFLEGNTGCLVNPGKNDPAVYGYEIPLNPPFPKGASFHVILEGRYRRSAWKTTRVIAEGLDPDTGSPVSAESFAWEEIWKYGDRLAAVEDKNIHTALNARERGEACLRQAEIEAVSGLVRAPVNCGQQLYDVIEITDRLAGLVSARRRVLGISLSWLPRRGEYEQVLTLGEV